MRYAGMLGTNIQLLFCVFISGLFVMKLEMTYMILHHNSWMSVPAQVGILAGNCTLWLGICTIYRTGAISGRATHIPPSYHRSS